MKTINKKIDNGFSVMEIIIYLSIFTVMSIVVINSFIIILSSFSSIRTNHDLLDSGSMAMERITREIRNAKSIDLTGSNSVFESNSGAIRLKDVDGTSYIDITRSTNFLNLSKNGTLFGNLLAPNIIVTKLYFRHIVTAKGEAIKIEMILQDKRSKINKTANFYDTVTLRGGIN